MKAHRIVSIALFLIAHQSVIDAKKNNYGVVIVPVADAIGSPIKNFFPNQIAEQSYEALPVCGNEPLASSSCPRLHQLLFNEIVTIIKEEGAEVLVKVSNCFYRSPQTDGPQHAYWTLKKNIISFKELAKNGITLRDFPSPITFDDAQSISPTHIVTLVMPWCDLQTNQSFSAGTRFVQEKAQDSAGTIIIKVFDNDKKSFILKTIPESLIARVPETGSEKRTLFVNILKKWAHLTNGIIPYVWGGCSFTTAIKNPTIETSKNRSLNCSFYTIKDFTNTPKTGFDCSNMIMRAAQIAGIPFFFKNSYTFATHMEPLKNTAQLKAGDIIAIPGHVMIVADINKNTLIEARGYKYKGQGKIQEIPVGKFFKNIDTFTQLTQAWRAQKSLERLGGDGSRVETVKQFKLLSLDNVLN